jgi:nucleoid-associated protein YgaU
MALQDKYGKLISYAQSSNVTDLSVKEQDNVLYVSGKASQSVKDQIWDIYTQIDPDMSAGDMVLSIDVIAGSEEIYEIKSGDNLSKIASKYPGMTWQKIFDANKDTIKDPNLIYPGQKIRIPV